MLPLPSKPKVIEKKDNQAVFEIDSLYPGYGVTIGNSLRRILLSSLSGSAITQVKIKGAQHEFSTLPGVLEDVINILLNLKQLRFKSFSPDPQTATLKVRGEKEVKGSDLKLSSQVELVNKNTHIASLTNRNASLEIEVQIEKGLGYETAEKRKKEKTGIGVMLLDSIFSPIKKVSYRVENMRVGERTDFDRLRIELETDGTISPEDAFFQASEILVKHFSLFSENFRPAPVKPAESKKEKKGNVEEEAVKTKIEDLKFSLRTKNALLKAGIKSVGGILKKDERALLTLEGMGEKGVREIKKIVKKLGFELKQ